MQKSHLTFSFVSIFFFKTLDKTQVMIRYIVNNQLRILANLEFAIPEKILLLCQTLSLIRHWTAKPLVQRLEQLLLPAPALSSSTVQNNILVFSVLMTPLENLCYRFLLELFFLKDSYRFLLKLVLLKISGSDFSCHDFSQKSLLAISLAMIFVQNIPSPHGYGMNDCTVEAYSVWWFPLLL